MAQKPISNRIEFGQNLNPLRDYAGRWKCTNTH